MRADYRLLAPALIAVALTGCEAEGPLPMVGALARDRYELVAEAAEPIVEVAVVEGDCVASGGLIVRLDDRRTAAALTAARAEQRRSESRLAELVRGPRGERIAAAQAELAGAVATLEVRIRERDRIHALEAKGVVSASELDVKAREVAAGEAARDTAQARLDELVGGTTSEELDQARAAVAAAAARAAELDIQSERLAVRAPRGACVEALPFELGERPANGATVAVLLADGAPWARIYVPEPLRARIVSGTLLDIEIDGVDATLTGRVRTVTSDAVFTPHFALTERDRSRLAYLAEVDLEGAGVERLPSGLPLEASLRESQVDDR